MVIIVPVFISILMLISNSWFSDKIVRIIYFYLLCASTVIMFFMIQDYKGISEPINFIQFLISILLIIIFYCSEVLLVNVIKNKVLILDYSFYFTGKVKLSQLFLSLPILIMEEIVFRLPVLAFNAYIWLLCGIASLCFGLVHVYFSKQDMISKVFLGFLLGCTLIISRNIYLVLLMHIFYNLLVFKTNVKDIVC